MLKQLLNRLKSVSSLTSSNNHQHLRCNHSAKNTFSSSCSSLRTTRFSEKCLSCELLSKLRASLYSLQISKAAALRSRGLKHLTVDTRAITLLRELAGRPCRLTLTPTRRLTKKSLPSSIKWTVAWIATIVQAVELRLQRSITVSSKWFKPLRIRNCCRLTNFELCHF